MDRRLAFVLIVVVVAGACTSGSTPGPTPSPQPSGPPTLTPGPEPLVLDVVADVMQGIGLGSIEQPNGYLEGMRLAVSQINAGRGVGGRPIELAVHDYGGDPGDGAGLIGEVLDGGPTAILYAGPGTTLGPLRARFAESGTPVVLLGGDLYTGRGMFPQVFQTTIPWEWQANVIARYVVTDREAEDVVFVGTGPEARTARVALADALAYWGGGLDSGFDDRDRDPATGLAKAFRRAGRAEWVVVFGDSLEALELANALEEDASIDRGTDPSDRPGVSGPSGLLVRSEALAHPEPGTSACNTYTWAGWAEPLPRVEKFRNQFRAFAGRLPTGLEQEGYEAVRTLVAALRQTEGEGGPALAEALEDTHRTFSGFPIDLGPDDHLFAPRDELGLFAVPGPEDELDPWLEGEGPAWMPLMRTFTYDGERTSVLDRDRTVFFPYWNENLPGPKYWRSRHGIASRPGQDPLH
jgi:ABC-type branched-subunit amino acid transport system substrate-binding protein